MKKAILIGIGIAAILLGVLTVARADITLWYLDGTTLKPVDSTWTVQGVGGAPEGATYITQTTNSTLTAEQALASLSTGIMRVATTTGVITSLTTSAGIIANISDETGSGALVFGTAPTITGGTHTALTSLGVRSTGTGAFDMIIANAENLTVGAKTLTIQLGDADRTLILGASPSLSGTNTGDQTTISGNAGTATALAADPADCVTSTHFSVGILASGAATCEAIADADVPDTITASSYLLLSGGTLTGTLTVAPASTDSIIISPVAQGAGLFTGTITSADLTTPNKVWTFPDTTGTVALTTSTVAAASDLTCTDCINATEIEDIYLLTAGNAASATYASATTITDDTTTVATMYPLWVTANTGNLATKVSSTKLSFVPSTGILTATGFAGALTGTASLATALAADPTDCGANTWATTIATSGNLTCAAVTYAGITAMTSANFAGLISDEQGTGVLVFGTAPTFASTITVGTAAGTTGAINLVGTTSGTVVLTVNAAAGTPTYVLPAAYGAAGTALTDAAGNGILSWAAGGGAGDVTAVGDCATGACFDGTQGTTLTFNNVGGDATIIYDGSTFTFSKFITANLTGNVTGNASGTAATVTGAAQASITSLGTLTTLTVDDITINGNTISSAGASTLAITPTAGQTITFDATVTLDAGVIAGATSITSTGFTGALTGNASTATALAADPGDCAANTFATTIAASGALTCAAVTYSGITAMTSANFATIVNDESGTGVVAFTTSPVFTTPNIGAATGSVSGNAGTATALAADPADCAASNFATGIAASGALTCGTIDISASTNLTAGRSLTLTGDDVLADAELYTDTKCVWIENPVATDDLKSIWRNSTANAFTFTEIWAESDQTVTFMLQVDDGTPADIDSVDLAPAAGEAEDTALDGDASLAASEELDLAVTSVANTPTWVSICWTGTWDD